MQPAPGRVARGAALELDGDPNNFGGISTVRVLKPGEKFTATVDVGKWFTFTEPDGTAVLFLRSEARSSSLCARWRRSSALAPRRD